MKTNRLVLLLLACASALVTLARGAVDRPPASPNPSPTLILISLDAFRSDYCALHPAETPNLRRLMQDGVSARGLISVFPSNTFPNHYSIVTGLYPSHHGIINNHMYDAELGAAFIYNSPASVADPRWWRGEPIWVTAIKQGRRSACSFWVGSEAAIEGVRPTWWRAYDAKVPFATRLAELANWLALPPEQRPAFIAFYIEEGNSVGHKYGPDSPELVSILRVLDDEVGRIRRCAEASGAGTNLVIVSDHGMSQATMERVVILDDAIDLKSVQVDFDESVAGLRPLAGTDVATVLGQLKRLEPHAQAYRVEDLPARFHIDPRSPRVPPIWVLPEEGWHVERRATFERTKSHFVRGQHGYDPALPAMHGILIAEGPAFKTGGAVIDEVENVHIYNLLCAVLGLHPAANDGGMRLVRTMLK